MYRKKRLIGAMFVVSVNPKSLPVQEVAEPEQTKEQKCCKKRGIKSCSQCCRCQECKTGKWHFDEGAVFKLVGEICRSALMDMYKPLPKNKSSRAMAKYHKSRAENFFKSQLFKYSGLSEEYVKRRFVEEMKNEHSQIYKR